MCVCVCGCEQRVDEEEGLERQQEQVEEEKNQEVEDKHPQYQMITHTHKSA
jgi:hypothetical protein